jgi:parvulin-like peptidyl-prolyl isomerase
MLTRQTLFLTIAVICANAATLQAAQEERLVDRVVAVVNNEVITQSEFDSVFRPVYQQIQQAYQGPDLDREAQDVRLKLLNQLIEDRLVFQEAKKLGVKVDDSEIQEELAAFKKQFKNEADFQEQIQMEGIKIKDIEERLRERLSIEKLHDAFIRGKVVVSPSEIEKYYKENPGEFAEKEKVEAWIITLPKNPDAISKGTMDEAAKKQAEKLAKILKKEANFEEIARKYSQDSHAKDGGHLGFIEKGSLVGNIEQALFSLPAGSVSDVLETEQAYHIFKVGQKSPPRQKTYEESKDQIREFIFRKKAHERFVQWMEELKKKSYISIR